MDKIAVLIPCYNESMTMAHDIPAFKPAKSFAAKVK